MSNMDNKLVVFALKVLDRLLEKGDLSQQTRIYKIRDNFGKTMSVVPITLNISDGKAATHKRDQ